MSDLVERLAQKWNDHIHHGGGIQDKADRAVAEFFTLAIADELGEHDHPCYSETADFLRSQCRGGEG